MHCASICCLVEGDSHDLSVFGIACARNRQWLTTLGQIDHVVPGDRVIDSQRGRDRVDQHCGATCGHIRAHCIHNRDVIFVQDRVAVPIQSGHLALALDAEADGLCALQGRDIQRGGKCNRAIQANCDGHFRAVLTDRDEHTIACLQGRERPKDSGHSGARTVAQSPRIQDRRGRGALTAVATTCCRRNCPGHAQSGGNPHPQAPAEPYGQRQFRHDFSRRRRNKHRAIGSDCHLGCCDTNNLTIAQSDLGAAIGSNLNRLDPIDRGGIHQTLCLGLGHKGKHQNCPPQACGQFAGLARDPFLHIIPPLGLIGHEIMFQMGRVFGHGILVRSRSNLERMTLRRTFAQSSMQGKSTIPFAGQIMDYQTQLRHNLDTKDMGHKRQHPASAGQPSKGSAMPISPAVS